MVEMNIRYFVDIWTDAQAKIWDGYKVKQSKERLEGIKILAKQRGVYEEVEKEALQQLDKSIFNPKKPENLQQYIKLLDIDEPEDQA